MPQGEKRKWITFIKIVETQIKKADGEHAGNLKSEMVESMQRNGKLTVLVELLCALAPLRQPDNRHHFGSQAGAPLLVASQWCRIGASAAWTFLQAVHGPRDAGGAHHVPGCSTQSTKAAQPTRAGHLHGAAEHHGPTELEGRWAGVRGKLEWSWGGVKQEIQIKHKREA